MQIFDPPVDVLRVIVPRLLVHARRRVLLQLKEARSQQLRREMMQQVGELQRLVPPCRFAPHRAIHATWLPTIRRAFGPTTGRRRSGSESGPGAIAPCSPRSDPFPPSTPRTTTPRTTTPRRAVLRRLLLADGCGPCSSTSSVLWVCLTPRRRARRRHGITPSPTDPGPWKIRMSPGSLGFREKGFQPCGWSQTPWGQDRTRQSRSILLLPSPCQDRVGPAKGCFRSSMHCPVVPL